MKIYYKVVTKRSRLSTNWGFYQSYKMGKSDFRGKQLSKLKREKIILKYTKRTLVKAKKDTLGIMVFDTEKNARSFTANNKDFRIVKVSGIKKNQQICDILDGCALNPNILLNWTAYIDSKYLPPFPFSMISPPLGTVFMSQVKVLD